MWSGRFVDTREQKKNLYSAYTVYLWELSECGNYVIITTPDNITPKQVMPEYEFARLANQKIIKYTDRPFVIK